ncbi:MAG: DUF5615 family PIN-like protein [Proteobacteria bacterium]|nr:DUF5615 family PIN-like protein [Pseudomonadota bacterium]
MKRLLLDQGLSRSTARSLNVADWDVVPVSDLGLSQATDTSIVACARQDARFASLWMPISILCWRPAVKAARL